MIKLFYYSGNFGDALSPYVVRKMSGQNIEFSQPYTLREYMQNLLACCKHCFSWSRDMIKRNMSFTRKPLLIAIGSLIENSTDNCILWGTGMAQPNILPKGGRIIMTRGPLSRKVLISNGYNVESFIGGDPALLLPLLYIPKVKNKGGVGFVCHNVDIDFIDKDRLPHNVKLISLKTDDVEPVIDAIVSCNIVFTTSLHGLIVSHAYGIPAVWTEREQLAGGHFKFNDYLLSVGIELYKPLSVNDVVNRMFLSNIEGVQLLPDKDMLEKAQKELIDRAPFTIVDNFKNETK